MASSRKKNREGQRQCREGVRAQESSAIRVHEVEHRVKKHPDTRRQCNAPGELVDGIGS